MQLNILFLGDVVGKQACNKLKSKLPGFKKLKGIDFCVANGENSADGDGITPQSALMLFESGVDVITTGNHVYKRKEIYGKLDEDPYILRPANYSASAPGKGSCVYDMGSFAIGVVNVSGMSFMSQCDNSFFSVDNELKKFDGFVTVKIVDVHAETTAEKQAMGHYLDGRVTLVAGTHTHVQTADEKILKGGTAYITDAGMCGPQDSVLGVKKEQAISRFTEGLPIRFAVADKDYIISGVIVEADEKTGRAKSIERICLQV